MSAVSQFMARLPAFADITKWSRVVQMGVAAGVLALIVVAALWLREPPYKVLFANLEDRDGGAIVSALTQMNVPYKVGDVGGAIMVPADKVHELRLLLAQQGLPRAGEAGFELLDQTRFGASQFTEQVNYQRALEGELTSSIDSLQAVQSSRVHLAIPRESLFVRDRQPPTASVLVTLYPGRSLSEAQVSAITWLVASSVPNLNPENVSVVDQNGRLLTAPSGEAGAESTRRSLVQEIEQRTVQRILTLLNPLVGEGNVRAQVSAEVDFAQREETSEIYRPNQLPGQAAVRSQQTSSSRQGGETLAEGIPGALTNQPPGTATAPITAPAAGNAGQAQGNAQNQAQGQQAGNAAQGQGNTATGAQATAAAMGNASNQATINYEVDRTISHIKSPVGSVQRLTAAVVVNYRMNDGEYEPLPQEELDKLNELVRQAMGYSAERGDSVSLVNSQFSMPPAIPVWRDPVYVDYAAQILKYLVIAFAIYLLWRLILRRLMIESKAAQERRQAELEMERLTREQEETAARIAADMNRYEDNLNTARELAKRDPRAVAMVLRNWMEKKDAPNPAPQPKP